MFRRILGRHQREDPESEAAPHNSILEIFDQAAANIAFPMLDNGYVYLAATRLSLHRSANDWVLSFEVFGFSPRSGVPDLSVWSLGSRLDGRKTPGDFANRAWYERYLAVHPHDESAFFFPVDGDWQDESDREFVRDGSAVVQIRGRGVALPSRNDYARNGIVLEDQDKIHTFEVCRYLAAIARDEVLATPEERRVHVPAGLDEILLLDDWHHPDTAGGQRPSETAAFRSIAEVITTGDVRAYDASEPANTHWSNWPLGGAL